MKLKTSSRGMFSLTTVVMLLMLVAGIWMGIQFFVAYFADIKIEQHMTETILKLRSETNDGVLAETIAVDLKARDEIEIDSKKIIILRSANGQKVSAQVPYIRVIKIPLIDKTWNIPFVAKAEEDLTRKF